MSAQDITARINTDDNGTVVTVSDHEGNDVKSFSYGPGRYNFGMTTEFHRAGYEITSSMMGNTCTVTLINFDA